MRLEVERGSPGVQINGTANVGIPQRSTADVDNRNDALELHDVQIKEREADDPQPMTGVADPAIFAEDGGPSLAHRMIQHGVVFRPADNKRVAGRGAMGGWDQLRARLVGDADGRPMVVIFATCRDLIRTLPALQHDDARAEDLDTDAEDHAADAMRYGVMSRPWIRDVKPEPVKDSWAQAYARAERSDADGWRVA
jgi:hypothetical protein